MKEEDVTIGQYKFITGKINIKVKTNLSGAKRLIELGLSEIKEIRYYNSEFHFVYSQGAGIILNNFLLLTWPDDILRFRFDGFINLSFYDDKDFYLRRVNFPSPTFSLEEITPDEELIFSIS